MNNEKDLVNNNVVEVNASEDTKMDYISALNDMKKNSVSKDEYDAIREENRKLMSSIVMGETSQQPVEEESNNVEDVREKLFGGEPLSNLEYAKTALELRDIEIKNGNPDPFLPSGKNVAPTYEDELKANNVAEGLRHAIEYADGDSAIFTQELQRITVDTAPRVRR